MPNYWIKRGDQIKGPFSGTNIRSLVDLGQVLPSDEISQSQAGPWQQLNKVRALATKIKTETVSMETSISLPAPQHAPPLVQQPQQQYLATQPPPPPQQHPPYAVPVQHPQYAAGPAPQIVYVQVPHAAQPVQIVNNVTSSNVNQNRNTALSGSGNSAVTLGLLLFVGAALCLTVEKPEIATYFSGAGMLACVVGALVSLTMWGRGLASSMVLFACNLIAMMIATSQIANKTNKPATATQVTQTASIGVIDRCC